VCVSVCVCGNFFFDMKNTKFEHFSDLLCPGGIFARKGEKCKKNWKTSEKSWFTLVARNLKPLACWRNNHRKIVRYFKVRLDSMYFRSLGRRVNRPSACFLAVGAYAPSPPSGTLCLPSLSCLMFYPTRAHQWVPLRLLPFAILYTGSPTGCTARARARICSSQWEGLMPRSLLLCVYSGSAMACRAEKHRKSGHIQFVFQRSNNGNAQKIFSRNAIDNVIYWSVF